MLSSLKRGMLAVGAAAAVVALGAASASAAGTWTVHAGTTATGSTTFTSTTTGASPQIAFKDLTTNTALNCTSGTAKGTVPHLGSGLAPQVAIITGTTWNTCTGPFNLVLNPAQVGSWTLNAVSYNATTQVTTGYISGVNVNVTSTPSGVCSFPVTGSVDATYSNVTHILSVATTAGTGHVLTIGTVSGCFGTVGTGHAASFIAQYLVTTPLGALTVTSP